MDKDIKMCIEKAKEEFFKLKKELGIKKDIENWGNMSVSIRKDRNYYRLILVYGRADRRSQFASISSYPITTPKEEIQKTEEYKKAKELIKYFKVIKRYRELEEACKEIEKN